MTASVRVRSAATTCLLLVACLGSAAPAGAAPVSSDRVLVVVAGGTVRMPSALRPGLNRFVVRAKGSSGGVQLMRPRPGYTVEEYGHDVERAGSRNRRVARAAERRIDEQVRFLGGAMADRGRRAVFWQRVPTGRLWAVSDDARPGDVHHVRVSGRARRPVPPPTTATLTVSDGSVQAPAVMPARGVLLFRNSGTGPHMVGLAKILDGRTVADVIAYLDAILDYSGSEGPPAASPIDESVYGAPTMAVDPGGAMSLGYSLPPGQYVAICVTLDRATGTFHIQHGEATNVTLT